VIIFLYNIQYYFLLRFTLLVKLVADT